MNWFVARIIFRVISGDGNHIPQFDEHLKLISAEDEKNAFQKASVVGQEGHDSFLNKSNEKVEWKFIGVTELTKINGLHDGIELFSKIIENDNADNYEYYIRQKNNDIESRLIPLKAKTIVS